MKITSGDLWKLDADLRVVTTNGILKKNGEAVMGKGIALQAAKRYPQLGRQLGECLAQSGNQAYFFAPDIATLPTKHHWKDPSDPKLIERSIQELIGICDAQGKQQILMPPPGCGLGGLAWDTVRELVAPLLDDRFTVVLYQPGL